MKKWLAGYIVLSLLILGVITFIGADRNSTNTTYSESIKINENVIQYANNYYGSYFLFSAGDNKIKVVDVDEKRQNYEILDFVYKDDCIYYMYKYNQYLNKTIYGFGCYGITERREYSYDIDDIAEYDWLDLGIKNDAIVCLMNDVKNRQIIEFGVNVSDGKEWEINQTVSFPYERYVVKAEYLNENLNICLDDGRAYYYIDMKMYDYKDISESPFVSYKGYSINETFSRKWFGNCMLKSLLTVIIPWGVVTLAGLIFVIGVNSRCSLVVRIYSVAQLVVVAIVCVSGIFFTLGWNKNAISIAYDAAQSGLISLAEESERKGSVTYEMLYDAADNGAYPYSEIIVIEKRSSIMEILSSLSLSRDGVDAQLMKAIDRENMSDWTRRSKLNIDGKTYLISVVYQDGLKSDTIWVGFVDYDIVASQYRNFMKSITLGAVIILISGVIIMSLIIIVYSTRWKKFSNALVDIAQNKFDNAIPTKLPNGLKREWSALKAISHKFGRSNYENILNLEQYSKYVPKDVAVLFDKSNILDIEIGEAKKIQCNVVDMSFEYGGCDNLEKYLAASSESYNVVYDTALKYEGIIVSQDADCTDGKVVFTNDISKSVEFAVHVLLRIRETQDVSKKIILIDSGTSSIGMIGSEKRAVPFVHYDSEKLLDKYKAVLRRSGVSLVVTEKVVNQYSGGFTFRYIGYLTDGVNNVKIYECIDAYSKIKKEILTKTLTIFKKAMGLYYSNDFYLARNAFNEVLKINPDDEIARWYLFSCENNLNTSTDSPTGYSLFGENN